MSRTGALVLLGILSMLVPFSGLPISIRTFLTVFFGACVFGIGFSLRAREVRGAQRSATETPPPPSPNPPTISPL